VDESLSSDSSGLGRALIQQAILLELLDQAPALVFVADDEMRYLAVNTTACQTLGYTRDELLTMQVTDIAVESDAGVLYEDMMRRRAQSGTTQIRTKDGRLLPFRYAAHETALGALQYYIAVGFVD
jgi:PAS domain S-box-containing protein